MMVNYGMFYLLMASLFLCIYLQRKINLLEQRNKTLCNQLLNVNCTVEEVNSLLEKRNEELASHIEHMDEVLVEDFEKDYATMAEELACKREEDADRIKEENLLTGSKNISDFSKPS